MLILAQVLVRKGNLDEAEPLLQEALTVFRDRYAMKPELTAQTENWLGAVKVARRAYSEAEGLMLPNAGLLFATTAAMSASEQSAAAAHLRDLYHAFGKTEQVVMWQAKIDGLRLTETTSASVKSEISSPKPQ